MHKSGQTGFTLLELMIVMTVVGIIAATAVPSYLDSVRKARRTRAMESLEQLALYQAKWRANNTTFASNANFTTSPGYPRYPTTGDYYTTSITANSTSTYTARATPVAGTDQTSDDCGTFALNQSGPFHAGYAGADCWNR